MIYEDVGVSISRNDAFVGFIKNHNITYNSKYPFGGFCSLYNIPDTTMYLACSVDGVGSKLILANKLKERNYLSLIGTDLVAMGANDVLTCGAIPSIFMDYYSTDQIDEYSKDIIMGIIDECHNQDIMLLGGETSEMPLLYSNGMTDLNNTIIGTFDLSGFCAGFIEEKDIININSIVEGDYIIGLSSSGLHSNGYALINSILTKADLLNESLMLSIMEPTRIYTSIIKNIRNYGIEIKGMAHITGGGIIGNVKRILSNDLYPEIYWYNWTEPSVYSFVRNSSISEEEMRNVFNMGIGFILIMDRYNYFKLRDSNFSYEKEMFYDVGRIKNK